MSASLLIATIQPIDWNATAAWIALVVSIIGTFIGPIITAIINNRHQLKLRKLDIKQRSVETYETRRHEAINTFLSEVGDCVTYSSCGTPGLTCGKAYFNIYQYVPDDMWSELDQLYDKLIRHGETDEVQRFQAITHRLSEILKEVPQVTP